jgi:uncharacterized repeat protein (TIGR03803 family)
MTFGGGDQGKGSVYELVPDGDNWQYQRIYNFCSLANCADGVSPFGSLIQDTSGNLYGTTSAGGMMGGGVVFELSPHDQNWKQKVIYSFCREEGCGDGEDSETALTYAGAASGLPYDGASPLYGTTRSGGEGYHGVVFSLTPHGRKWKEKVLHRFDASSYDPTGTLLVDGEGNLFGTAFSDSGSVFELRHRARKWKYTLLYSFKGARDGDRPKSGLLLDETGNVLGTTDAGGKHFGGVAFSITPNGKSSRESVLYAFCSLSDCADGELPPGGMVMDSAGTLVGNTQVGGGHDIDESGWGGGTVYRLDGNSLTTLYSFCAQASCADGAYPRDVPALDSTGNIFGVTTRGGANDHGTVFELVP